MVQKFSRGKVEVYLDVSMYSRAEGEHGLLARFLLSILLEDSKKPLPGVASLSV